MNTEQLNHFLPYILLACLAGLVRFFSENKGANKVSLFDMFGDVLLSGFVGIMIIFICDEMKLSGSMSGALVGWGSHEATRFIFLIKRKIAREIGVSDDDLTTKG